MAFTRTTTASDGAASSVTVSLVDGWDQIPEKRGGRPPLAGDVVILEIVRPEAGVTGPPGWNHDGACTWWKMIGPVELPPVFHAQGSPEWEVRGIAVWGGTPFDDSGTSAFPDLSSAPAPVITWEGDVGGA